VACVWGELQQLPIYNEKSIRKLEHVDWVVESPLLFILSVHCVCLGLADLGIGVREQGALPRYLLMDGRRIDSFGLYVRYLRY
jgi:hypothetical protein